MIDFGNTLFLLDEPTLNDEEAKQLLKYKSFTEYLRSNPLLFLKNYQRNVDSILTFSKDYMLVLSAMLLVLLIWFFLLGTNLKAILKLITIGLIFLFMPFVVSINVGVSERFFAPYVAVMFIALLIGFLMSKHSEGKIKHYILLYAIIVSSIHFGMFIDRELEPLREKEKIYKTILTDYNKEFEQGNNPLFLSLLSAVTLPGKMFDPLSNNYKQYRFMNLGMLDHTKFFRKRNETIYGKDYASLIARVQNLEGNGKYFYANPYTLSFIDSYLRNVYNYELCYKQVENFEILQENQQIKVFKYKIEDHFINSCSQ